MTNRLPALMAEKQLKENRVINVSVVARELGVSRQYLHKWVKDVFKGYDKEMIDRFCDYFNCEPGDIIIRVKDEQQREPVGVV